jgi:hypothetical protein
MLGPGPILNTTTLGGYQIVFRDPINRATRPGTLSVALRHHGHTVEAAGVKVAYHSLDMPMPASTLTLVSHGRGYQQQGPLLEMGGRWRITIAVSLPQGRQLQVTLTDLIAR